MRFLLVVVVALSACGAPAHPVTASNVVHPCAKPFTRAPTVKGLGGAAGYLCDASDGSAMIGATLVFDSPALANEQVVIADEDGFYEVKDLPPGAYRMTVYYNDQAFEFSNIAITAGRIVTVNEDVANIPQGNGELIRITGSAPIIDPTSTAQGISFSGSSSIENAYDVDTPEPAHHETYAHHDANPFARVDTAPLSTFSIDVDTAAYSIARRHLRDGERPPPDAVRVEEMLNYFAYDYPAPAGDAPVSITTEVGPAPWNAAHQIARIGLASAPIAAASVPPRNLTFLVDVSGSMDEPTKLPLLQLALGLVVDQLRAEDRIAIVVYAGASGLVLPPTPGTEKRAIKTALANLEPGGGTNGAAGIQLAYDTARTSFVRGGINRVILCTDGDFNLGATSEADLQKLIERERGGGVFLSVLGFGTGNTNDATMELLADKGNGNYAYIDTIAEARKVLVQQAGATLVTVAKDVKIQVEFDKRVASYRLLGYEDRMLADKDFADDKKDAGELGAGHAVTALYELVPAAGARSGDLMTVRVRYKSPHGTTSKLLEHRVASRAIALDQTSADFRWACAVAGFGMLLRGTPEPGSLSYPIVEALARGAQGPDPQGYRAELVSLVQAAVSAKAPPTN